MGLTNSVLPEDDDDEAISTLPDESRPRQKIGRNQTKSSKSQGKIKHESLRSALSVELENPEAEKIRKEFDLFRRNKENELTNAKRKERKLETENRKLKTELQALQKTCKKLRDERIDALEAEQRALMRASAIENDRDKIQRQFKIFRETKEGELQNLLKVKRNLESRLIKFDPSFLENGMNHQRNGDATNSTDKWAAEADSPVSGGMYPTLTNRHPHREIYKPPATSKGSTASQSYRPYGAVESGSSWKTSSNVVTVCSLSSRVRQDHNQNLHNQEIKDNLMRICSTKFHILNFLNVSLDNFVHNKMAAIKVLLEFLENNFLVIFVLSSSFRKQDFPILEEFVTTCTSDEKFFIASDLRSNMNSFWEEVERLRKTGENVPDIFPIESSIGWKTVENFIDEKITKKISKFETDCLNYMGWDNVWIWQDLQDGLFSECISNFVSSCTGRSFHHEAYYSCSWLNKYLDHISKHVSSAGPLPPLLVIGPRGCGKTVLLSKWIDQYRERSPSSVVISYSVPRADHSSSDLTVIIKSLMFQVMQCLSTFFSLVHDSFQLVRDFPKWLDKVSVLFAGGITLVIDSIDFIPNFETAFDWLMDPLPVDVRVVISSGVETCPNTWRSWPTVKLDPMLEDEVKQLVDVMTSFARHEEMESSRILPSSFPFGNLLGCYPLSVSVAMTLLEDCEFTTSSSELENCRNESDIYLLTLKNLEESFSDTNDLELFREALSFISCSRNGLSVSELIELLLWTSHPGDHDNDDDEEEEQVEEMNSDTGCIAKRELTEIDWLRCSEILQRSLKFKLIKFCCGLLVLHNNHVKVAIKKWLNSNRTSLRNGISDDDDDDDQFEVTSMLKLKEFYFFNRKNFVTFKMADEVVWLNYNLKDIEALSSFLVDVRVVAVFLERGLSLELSSYWSVLGIESANTVAQMERQLQSHSQSNSSDLVSRAYEHLGRLSSELGLNEEALGILQKCIEIHEMELVSDDLKFGRVSNILGQVHEKLGRRTVAETFYLRSLSLFESLLLLEEGGDNPGAEKMAGIGAEIRDCGSGKSEKGVRPRDCRPKYRYHHLVTSQLDLLAGLHQKQGRIEFSEHFSKKAADLRLRVLSSEKAKNLKIDKEIAKQRIENLTREMEGYEGDQASLVSAERELGILNAILGNTKEAESYLVRSLDRCESLLPTHHSQIVQSLNGLAVLYAQSKQLHKFDKTAEKLLISLQKKSSVEDSALTMAMLKNLISASRSVGRTNETGAYLQMLLEAVKQSSSCSPEEAALAMTNLAVFYSQQGKHVEAEPLYKEALETYRSVFSPGHPRIIETVKNLALLKYEQGDYEFAAQLYISTVSS